MNVTTITGEVINKKLTRKIKNLQDIFAYYKIGNINQKDSGDCYQINNIFYKIRSIIMQDLRSEVYKQRMTYKVQVMLSSGAGAKLKDVTAALEGRLPLGVAPLPAKALVHVRRES